MTECSYKTTKQRADYELWLKEYSERNLYEYQKDLLKMMLERDVKMANLEYKNTHNENYDTPIHLIERDNKQIYLYEAIGIGESDVKIEEEFVNRFKEFYIRIVGKTDIIEGEWENDINIRLMVDRHSYNAYSVFFKDGLIIVELHEIINERPDIKRI